MTRRQISHDYSEQIIKALKSVPDGYEVSCTGKIADRDLSLQIENGKVTWKPVRQNSIGKNRAHGNVLRWIETN